MSNRERIRWIALGVIFYGGIIGVIWFLVEVFLTR